MNVEKKKVAVIGAGNLAWNLIPNLQEKGHEVLQLISRNSQTLVEFQQAFSLPSTAQTLSALTEEAHFVFLTVPDGQIARIAEELSPYRAKRHIFVHTSGSISLDALKSLGNRIGVFYPMQIFTRKRISSFDSLPIFWEARDAAVSATLEALAQDVSPKVLRLDSEDRLRLHLGAVLTCNFSNYLYRMAEEHLPKHPQLDFRIYEDLIREHIDKALAFGPQNSQTGPAIRKDLPTLKKHVELLHRKPAQQKLYKDISRLIRPDLDM